MQSRISFSAFLITAFALCMLCAQLQAENESQNKTNNILLSASPAQQASVLGQAVGGECVGKTAFYMGIGKEGYLKDVAFWSLRCSNGKEYELEIRPDAIGSTRALDCSIIEDTKVGHCFKKFEEQ